MLKSLTVAAVFFAAFALLQCNKTQDVPTTDSLKASTTSYVSPVEQAMNQEMETLGMEEIIECIYECVNSLPVEDLSESEIETLNYVREEEYLAHDVYVAMYDLYNVPVFNNISNSEFIHSTAIQALLEKYELPDPGAGHEPGVFQNPDIQALYDALVEQGSASFQDALVVGATIEDVDIWDLKEHLINDVDNTDITYALEQLYRGSRNHMRAFSAHLDFQGMTYTPQYISQELYDEIIGSGWEVGNGFCICNTGIGDNNTDMRSE